MKTAFGLFSDSRGNRMKTKIGAFLSNRHTLLVFRVLVGLLFASAGILKLLQPWQEFAAQIRNYEVIGGPLVNVAAQVLPWIQAVFGLLLILGLFPRISLAVLNGLLLVFMPVVASTILRGMSLDDCGCFGSIGIKETPQVVLIRDGITLLMSIPLWKAWGFRPGKKLGLDSEPVGEN